MRGRLQPPSFYQRMNRSRRLPGTSAGNNGTIEARGTISVKCIRLSPFVTAFVR